MFITETQMTFHSFIYSFMYNVKFIYWTLIFARHCLDVGHLKMDRALTLSLQNLYLVAKKISKDNCITGVIMEVDHLYHGSAFESMSTISNIFVVISIFSCMSRELVLTWTDGRVFSKKVHLNQALSFSGRRKYIAWLAFLGGKR